MHYRIKFLNFIKPHLPGLGVQNWTKNRELNSSGKYRMKNNCDYIVLSSRFGNDLGILVEV